MSPDGSGSPEPVKVLSPRPAAEGIAEFFTYSLTGMARVSRDGRFQLVNDAFCRMLGYTREELLALSALEITHPKDRAASQLFSKQTWADATGEQLGTMQKRYLRKNGSALHAEIHLTPIRDARGAPHYSLVQVLSTEERWHRHKVETAHRRVLELLTDDQPLDFVLHEIIKHAEAGSDRLRAAILLTDEAGQAFDKIFAPSLPPSCRKVFQGAPVLEGVGSCATGIVRGERIIVEDVFNDPLWAGFEALAEEAAIASCWSQPISGEEGRRLGSLALLSSYPRTPSASEIVFIEGMANLVAIAVQRHRVLEALRMSRARFKTLVEHAPEAVVLFDYDTCRFIEANQRVRQIFKSSPKGLLATDPSDLAPTYQPDGRLSLDAIVAEIEAAKSGASPVFDWVCLDIMGCPVHIEIRLVRLPTKTGTLIRGSMIDISNRLAAEQALRASEESLRATLDSIGDAVVAVNSEGRITQFNPVAAKLLDSTNSAALGMPLDELLTLRAPRTRDRLDPLNRGERTGSAEPHVIMVSAQGSETYVSERITPIRDSEGNISGTVLTFRDVTKQRDAQERMLQARKLEAIGQLAGGVAHDFNNLLTGILGNAELLREHSQVEVNGPASMIAIAARRAGGLTDQLLRFSRNEPARHELLDIHQLLRETCQLMAHSMDKRILIETELNALNPTVAGDASQLQNAFLNLGLNARDALEGSGRITISTRDLTTPEHSIEVCFTDTGTGIDPAIMEHIFEPFFTTKEVGAGTGLGLAGTYGIVRSHSGRVEVSSQLGEGTCFTITLPSSSGGAPAETSEAPAAQRGSGRILVVDDEDLVRSFVVRALNSFGYEAIGVEDGVLAERLVTPGTFDLVVLDLVMPRRSGLDTFRAIAAIDPDLPVLISSGFSRDHSVEEVLAAGAVGFLHKPFQLNELALAVAEAISTSGKPK